MKIGVLTFHRASNFGGALQSYALVRYLRKKGYDAETIDYLSPAIEKSYSLVRFDNLKLLLISLMSIRYRKKLNSNFNEFRKLMTVSKKKYHNASELCNEYDIIIIGSDQVWSKRINNGFDPVFWGNIDGHTKITSYAASMGTDHCFTEEERNLISRYLDRFDAISVREDSLKAELSNYTKKHICTVVDPTLLLNEDDYINISDTTKIPFDNYVFYYQMEYNKESQKRVSEVAKQLKCNIIILGGKKEIDDIPTVLYSYADISVPFFLGLIKNARCVFASSFHGTALSIALKKDFYFFANFEPDRAENLLKHIGALDRLKKSDESFQYEPVDYSLINERIESYVTMSKTFIESKIIL